MAEPNFEFVVAMLVIMLTVGGLAIWRVGQVVSWRALLETAQATGSFTTCMAYIRFCARRSR